MTAATFGESVVRALEARGVDTVFGIPGVHTLELYRGLSTSEIRHVSPRHEQGAGFMADAYARVTGRPGVCFVISGPGVTNAITPVAQAYADSIPMLVVSSVVSRPELGAGWGALHDLPDQRALMAEVTSFSHTLTDPDELPEVLDRAFASFAAGRPRPVHVEIPVDVLASPAAVAVPDPAPAPSPLHPDPAAVARVAGMLSSADRPLLLLGGGAAGASSEALALADRLDAVVVTTVGGKGVVPEGHPQSLGATLPFDPTLDEVAAADVVLAVGTELSDVDLMPSVRALEIPGALVRVDVDPQQLVRRHRPACALLGDAALTLRSLAEAADARPPGRAAGRVAAALGRTRWTDDVERHRPVLDAVRRALPDDAVVACDSTQLAYSAHAAFPVRRPRSWIAPIGYGALGCGLPGAVGAKVGAPDRPVACVAGDGGFLFTFEELATAAELGLALPVVLWNTSGYAEIEDSMRRAGIPPVGVDLFTPDLLAVARGFGCHAHRAEDLEDLAGAVDRALSADRPTVIDVRDDGTLVPARR
jgi:acetolactate synthase I/II/III large subunit